ncbi:hypothetical protein BR93DRAFT_930717 [Coniochaeta sp. PMI_546]|nr:hypothetical protein BR93DRAFT_930717 [Coniochaeta sp. PMI_546]
MRKALFHSIIRGTQASLALLDRTMKLKMRYGQLFCLHPNNSPATVLNGPGIQPLRRTSVARTAKIHSPPRAFRQNTSKRTSVLISARLAIAHSPSPGGLTVTVTSKGFMVRRGGTANSRDVLISLRRTAHYGTRASKDTWKSGTGRKLVTLA